MLLMASAACTKEVAQEIPESLLSVYELQNDFNPPGEAWVRANVAQFLDAVPADEVAGRTTFEDTEVHEARWIMEAAGNYVYNVNAQSGEITTFQEYTLNVTNTTDASGELQMEGSAMTTAFASLQNSINQDAAQIGKAPALVDIELQQADGQASTIKAKVGYVKSAVPVGGCDNDPNIPNPTTNWDNAAQVVEEMIVDSLAAFYAIEPGCGIWTPQTAIYTWDGNSNDVFRCNNSGVICLTQRSGNPPPQYQCVWAPVDASAAIDIAMEYIQQYNTLPNGGVYEHPWVLESIYLDDFDFFWEGTIDVHTVGLNFRYIIAIQLSYCY